MQVKYIFIKFFSARIHYLVKVIWNVLYPAMKEASLVSDCLPEPPTPTRRACPLGVRMIREIFTRWVMASLKNTRSIPEPRILSLYCCRNISNLSSKTSNDGTYVQKIQTFINILSTETVQTETVKFYGLYR